MLELKNLSFTLHKTEILKDVSFQFEKGKIYGIIGPNGSGKTTLLDLLTGYRKPTLGSVEVFGKNIHKYSHRDLAKKISLVPQQFDTHFNYTALEIIKMGRFPYHDSILDNDDDSNIIDRYIEKFSLEKLLKKDILEMSGGERQRVLFVKALVQESDFILLDEATSNLDPYHAHNLLSLLVEEVKSTNKTVIAVIHDLNLASYYCDQLIMMQDGCILKSGNTNEVLTEENIEELFQVSSKFYEEAGKKFVFSFLKR